MQPAKYPFSKDYDALYEHMMAGGEALGFVDEEFLDHNAITFKTVVERSPFSMREQNGTVRVLMRGMISFWTERDVFVRECKILNLEWAVPFEVKTCYVQLHKGGGSMSECAYPNIVFGPYARVEAEAICEKLYSTGICDGYDSGIHPVIVDVNTTSLDIETYCKEATSK